MESEEAALISEEADKRLKEAEKELARLRSAMAELERMNDKLADKIEKTAAENLSLHEEIATLRLADANVEIEDEAYVTETDLEIAEIDYSLKYAFVIKSYQPLEIEQLLRDTFPNCLIVNDTKRINKTVDLAVFLTGFTSHSLYSGVKRECKDAGIPYIHCSNINIDRIVRQIWNYYNTAK